MNTRRSTRSGAGTAQLSLFTSPGVPDRFRIDEATRRRGLRHVARLRAQLEARYPSAPGKSPSPGRAA